MWGAAYSNVSMGCRLKGHIKCRKAFGVLDASKEQLEHWLLDGIGKSGPEHVAIGLRQGVMKNIYDMYIVLQCVVGEVICHPCESRV